MNCKQVVYQNKCKQVVFTTNNFPYTSNVTTTDVFGNILQVPWQVFVFLVTKHTSGLVGVSFTLQAFFSMIELSEKLELRGFSR